MIRKFIRDVKLAYSYHYSNDPTLTGTGMLYMPPILILVMFPLFTYVIFTEGFQTDLILWATGSVVLGFLMLVALVKFPWLSKHF